MQSYIGHWTQLLVFSLLYTMQCIQRDQTPCYPNPQRPLTSLTHVLWRTTTSAYLSSVNSSSWSIGVIFSKKHKKGKTNVKNNTRKESKMPKKNKTKGREMLKKKQEREENCQKNCQEREKNARDGRHGDRSRCELHEAESHLSSF